MPKRLHNSDISRGSNAYSVKTTYCTSPAKHKINDFLLQENFSKIFIFKKRSEREAQLLKITKLENSGAIFFLCTFNSKLIVQTSIFSSIIRRIFLISSETL